MTLKKLFVEVRLSELDENNSNENSSIIAFFGTKVTDQKLDFVKLKIKEMREMLSAKNNP